MSAFRCSDCGEAPVDGQGRRCEPCTARAEGRPPRDLCSACGTVPVAGPNMKCRDCAGAPGGTPVPSPGAAGPATNRRGDDPPPSAPAAASAPLTPEQAAALDIARELASDGIPIFVAYPDPDPTSDLGFKLPPEWQKTKADPRYVDAWRPGLALCMVAGQGLDVNDIDPRNGGALATLEAALAQRGGSLPRTYGEAATPSGGQHLFIKSLGMGKHTGFLPGIDYLGGDEQGGGRSFVFLPPTVRKSKVTGEPVAYRWVKPLDLAGLEDDTSGEAQRALLVELDQARQAGAGRQNGPGPAALPEVARARRVAAAIARQRRKWAGMRIPEGKRNDWLFRRGSALRGAGATEAKILAELRELNAAHCAPPLTDKEVAMCAHSAERYEPGPVPPAANAGIDWSRCDRTDTGNAELLVQLYGGRLLYDPVRGRWLLFGGHRWREVVGGEVERLHLEAADCRRARGLELLGEAATPEQEKAANAEIDYARRSRDHTRITAALAVAQKIAPFDAGDEPWDQHHHLRAVANGVIDLRTGELRAGRHADRITRGLALAYDPAATSPRWLQFLEEICEENRERVAFLQRAIGYTLTGETREQAFFVLLGSGANGKSVLLAILGALLGDLGAAIPSSVICEGEGRPSPVELAAIDGRCLVTCAEVVSDRLHVDRIKALTGGDVVAARELYQKPFNFIPRAKLWLAMNHLPRQRPRAVGGVEERDEAFERRMHLIRLSRSFTGPDCDPTLIETLKGELPGILAWAVRGAGALYAHGLQPPEEVLWAGWGELEKADDLAPLERFLDERCVRADGLKVSGGELYAAYRQWVEQVGGEAMSQTLFGRRLRARVRKKREGPGMVYLGIGLAPPPAPRVWCQTPSCSQALDPGATCPGCGVPPGAYHPLHVEL